MTLAIFGGSGRTGKLLVHQALDRGFKVRVLVRDPARLRIKHEGLELITGGLDEADAVLRTLTGATVVISVLGPASNQAVSAISNGMSVILRSMQELGMMRIVMTAGAGVGDPLDHPRPADRLVSLALRLLAGNVLADMTRCVKLVRESTLDWTIIRLPMLTDSPPSGRVQMGYLGSGIGSRISRHDVAGYLLDHLQDQSLIRKAPVIADGPRQTKV